MTDDERAHIAERLGDLAIEVERLYEQHENRLAEEERRESTLAKALRHMASEPNVDATALRTLSEQMNQRFRATMTEFAERTVHLQILHGETLALLDALRAVAPSAPLPREDIPS